MIHIASLSGRGTCAIFSFPIAGDKGGETSPFNTIYIQYVPACIFCVHEGLCGKCTDVEAANCCYEMIHIASMSVRATCANFYYPIAGNKKGRQGRRKLICTGPAGEL